MKVHCPYLKRKFLTDSVTTHKLFKTFLRQIEYQPFKRRLVEVMSEFSGNRQFVDRGHCERFSEAIKVISSYDYNSLAALYVLTMSPSLWYDVTLSVNRYTAISPFTNKKEDGSTEVYSLFDFKDFRENMDAEKCYLQGRFDAVPYINSSISIIKNLLGE
jgi:hypothetical protein